MARTCPPGGASVSGFACRSSNVPVPSRIQLAAAATAGLVPMTAFMSASVNPDALLYALWSLALWLGVRILKRGLTLTDAAGLFAVVGLAVTAKATSYALVPAAVLVLAIGLWRLRRRDQNFVPPPNRNCCTRS